MKKPLVLFCIIASAITSYAASIDWSVANRAWQLKSGSYANQGYTVYLTLAASQDNLIAALKGGATSFTTDTAGILAVGQTTSKWGGMTETTASSSSLIAGSASEFSVLIIDTVSEAGKTFYNFSGKLSERAYDASGSDVIKFSVTFAASTFNDTAGATGWTAVPEPTSGLLMLLGMAGLALKRKRA